MTTNMARIRARPAASAATKRAHRTTTPTTPTHQLLAANKRAGSASQASQLTAYGLGIARSNALRGDHEDTRSTGMTGEASKARGGPMRTTQEQRSASRCDLR